MHDHDDHRLGQHQWKDGMFQIFDPHNLSAWIGTEDPDADLIDLGEWA